MDPSAQHMTVNTEEVEELVLENRIIIIRDLTRVLWHWRPPIPQ